MLAKMHAELASELIKSRLCKQQISPFSERFNDISLDDAYAISRLAFNERLKQPGVTEKGRKIGLTSRAVQKQLGVNEPDFGFLTSDMEIPSGGVLPRGSLMQGRAEGEVAFLLKDNLSGTSLTVEDIIKATEAVIPCIEVIDSRIKDWKIKIHDTVSDNASSAFYVLGKPVSLQSVDLRMAGMTLRKNGEVESTGVGVACLDHPLNAVLWLAKCFSERGDALRKGSIILSGAYGPVVPFVEGDHCEVEISGLGKVSLSYEK